MRRAIKVVLIGLAVFMAAYWLFGTLTAKGRDIATAREWGRLAPLPESARDVQVASFQSLFSGQVFVRFSAPPQEIEAFLAASPGLMGVKPERFTRTRQHLPRPDRSPSGDPEAPRHRYHRDYARNYGIPWYAPTIREKGRRYAIPWDSDQHYGEVIVDDARHVVYLTVSYS